MSTNRSRTIVSYMKVSSRLFITQLFQAGKASRLLRLFMFVCSTL